MSGDLRKETGVVVYVTHRDKMSADMEEEIVLSASKACMMYLSTIKL